ncbi:MAG: hypothetical protein H7Y38_10360 [Armatimonadetes bacterium]|nr:hypothetical protein [Armatimonadota bacterium]
MSLAKKLRDVVAANFIEIARVEPAPVKREEPVATDTYSDSLGTFAEAELDSFLKDINAAPSAAQPAPEPVAVPEPIKAAPVLVSLADAISDEGDLDFARVFQQYELPTASFSAEQAMNMLQSLPRDLALRTKRVTVNTTLSAIGKVVGTTPQDIVVDAARKKETLERYIESLGHEIEETTATTEAEIERLQMVIATHRDTLRLLARKRSAAQEVCRGRMDTFDQVIHFFDYDEERLADAESVAVAEEMSDESEPSFMQEDAVRRMLGIDENDMTDENGNFDPAKFAQIYGDGSEDDTDAKAAPALASADSSNGSRPKR